MLTPRAIAAAAGCLIASVCAQEDSFFYKSHDLSSLRVLENGGGAVYYDTARGNVSRPIEDILRDGGMNAIKLRLFVDPTGDDAGKYDLPGTIEVAKRFVSGAGFRLILNTHLSDTWGDPGRQTIPRAWPTDLEGLSATLRKYMSDTLTAFCDAGVAPDIVTIGNEISRGMLWPVGRFDPWEQPIENRTRTMASFARLYKAARLGIDDAVAAPGSNGSCKAVPEVSMHLDAGWDTELYANIYSGMFNNTDILSTDDLDVFGLTLYPFYGNAGTFANLRRTSEYLINTYGKKIHVLETDWPVDCDGTYLPAGRSPPVLSELSIPVSAQGQLQWIGNITEVMRSLPNGLGQGVSYWEGGWLNFSTSGIGGCDDLLLFDQAYQNTAPNFNGYSRESVNMFLH
ncbi:unnamed protein product [Discula destructiva]